MILSREKSEALIREFIKYGAKKYVIKDDYFIDTLVETIDNHFLELNSLRLMTAIEACLSGL